MGRLNEFEVPPPGAGLATAIVIVPVLAISAAVTASESCVAEMNVVVRSAPLNFTTEPAMKPIPAMFSVNAASPAKTVAGFRFVNAGAGLFIVNIASGESPPPGGGVFTESFKIAAEARSVTDKRMESFVAEIKIVPRSTPLTFTVESGLKPVPFTVKTVAALPTKTEFGLSVIEPGAGLLIAKLSVLEVPPPGAGLTIVIAAVPAFAMSEAVTPMDNCVAEI